MVTQKKDPFYESEVPVSMWKIYGKGFLALFIVISGFNLVLSALLFFPWNALNAALQGSLELPFWTCFGALWVLELLLFFLIILSPKPPSDGIEHPFEWRECFTFQEFLNPKGTPQPGDSDRISDEGGFGALDRREYLGQEGVTQKQIDDAVAWWNRKENKLNQFMAVSTAMDLVNSIVYAKFLVAGHRLLEYSDFKMPKGKLGVIVLNPMSGGNYVDVYHEAWHAFSQLFLTREQKIKLYDEIRNSNPQYKNMKSIEIEEILAENFREYARNPKPVKQQPVRNTLFRKILNFLLNLFGKLNKSNLLDTDILSLEGVQKYFNELYIGEINNYTPLIENVMFDQLNRGITDVTDKRTELLNDQYSTEVVNSISALLSKVVDEQAEDSGIEAGTVDILKNRIPRTAFLDVFRSFVGARITAVFPNNPVSKTSFGRD
jgi:hypothetical protein